MTPVVLTDLRAANRTALRKSSLRKQKVRSETGEVRLLYRLDVGADDFDIQFTKAFELSVARARKRQRDLNGASGGE